MKKSIILLACVLGAFSAKAQTVIESTKFTDNWSVGINAGAVTPLTHSAFFKSMRPAFRKDVIYKEHYLCVLKR